MSIPSDKLEEIKNNLKNIIIDNYENIGTHFP